MAGRQDSDVGWVVGTATATVDDMALLQPPPPPQPQRDHILCDGRKACCSTTRHYICYQPLPWCHGSIRQAETPVPVLPGSLPPHPNRRFGHLPVFCSFLSPSLLLCGLPASISCPATTQHFCQLLLFYYTFRKHELPACPINPTMLRIYCHTAYYITHMACLPLVPFEHLPCEK